MTPDLSAVMKRIDAQVVAAMKKVKAGTPIRFAAAEIGMMPFELEMLYKDACIRETERET